MLPSHRSQPSPSSSGSERGWRAMSMDHDSKASHILSFLRVKPTRLVYRTIFLVLIGTLVLSWFLITQLGSAPFTTGLLPPLPFFGPGEELDDYEWSFAGKGQPNWPARAARVKQSFLHAYHGYERLAAPRDELLPLSNGSVDNFNGWGVTLVDSLDTMHIMGLHDEFARGVRQVEKTNFFVLKGQYVPFFETVIRYLGGYLSGYALSGDRTLLAKADELGAALLPAFNTTSGFPLFAIDPSTSESRAGHRMNKASGWLAEVASCMMEYKYLAKVTGRKEYFAVADNIMQRLYHANVTRYPNGLLPMLWNLETGQPVNDQISIGAMADSAYEYLLKQYLMTNQTEPESLDIYLRTMRGIMDHAMFLSPTRSFVYVTDISAKSGAPSRRFEHLSCFLPGLLALGAARIPQAEFAPYSEYSDGLPSEYERHRWAAEGLGIGCATMYSDMPTGLGADEVLITTKTDLEREIRRKEKVQQQAEDRAKKLAEKEAGKQQGKREPEPQPAPPFRPNSKFDKGKSPIRKIPQALETNQTLEDIRLRWGNVIDAWRAGRFDGSNNEYIGAKDEGDDASSYGHMWASGPRGVDRVGPVPGLRDPPLEPWENTELGRDYRLKSPSYQLRPETIESYFILWRTTKNPVWRNRGWEAYKAIETQLKTPAGYATIRSVSSADSPLQDSMPSFLLAETFKYLYLLFSDDEVVPLDKYVFNTEAHPFPVFEWTEAEKRKFGIL